MSTSCARKHFEDGGKLITNPKLIILSDLYDLYTELFSNAKRDSPNHNNASDAFLDHCCLSILTEDG